jgi:hypothetical protein
MSTDTESFKSADTDTETDISADTETKTDNFLSLMVTGGTSSEKICMPIVHLITWPKRMKHKEHEKIHFNRSSH